MNPLLILTLITLLIGLALNVYMYLAARRTVYKIGKSMREYDFPTNRVGQWRWLKAYIKLAKSQKLPVWPAYVSLFFLFGTALLLIIYLIKM